MDEEAQRIVRALCNGTFRLTFHAQERMHERNVGMADIQSCGETVKTVQATGDGKYKVTGRDLDGEKLTVVCVWEGETLIITLF